ncbi:hypothetical protein BDY19DRAFT_935834 [Irpex rosettiformis]|uniref:Uncharacterized protein n=1 Tax=Irpex rosettiformis TaxID=378272 RepID=A0ACB8U8K0_9APHY|nr:hypothetical protein BDY19DRAFT_935834 [Irpex rosettiformis]
MVLVSMSNSLSFSTGFTLDTYHKDRRSSQYSRKSGRACKFKKYHSPQPCSPELRIALPIR